MAHSGKTMTFATDLVPQEDNVYSLGDFDQKWKIHGEIQPIATKTYTDVIATLNSSNKVDQNTGGFFYAKVRADDYNKIWHTKVRIIASVPGNASFYATSIYDLWGITNTYLAYKCQNAIRSTSYRPLYYNTYFRVNQTGYNNNMGGWLGFSLLNANSATSTNLKRTVIIELLEQEDCTVELHDSLVTPTNIPNRTTSGYYSSTNTSYDNFDFCTNGLRESGDDTGNDTDRTLQELFYFRFKSGAAGIGRYTLLMEESTGVYSSLTTTFPSSNTPLTTLTMNSGVKYKPGRIIYFNQGANRAANTNIGNNNQYFVAYDLIDLRYTFQFTAGALTAYKPFYMVGTLDSDGLFTINSNAAEAWTQTLPETASGNTVYIYLGMVYPDTNPYRIELELHHPIYKSASKQVSPGDITGNADTASLLLSPNMTDDNLPTPSENATGVKFEFKKREQLNFSNDFPSYAGIMTYRPYGNEVDLSGGPVHQVAFNANGLYWRTSSSINTWNDWRPMFIENTYSANKFHLLGLDSTASTDVHNGTYYHTDLFAQDGNLSAKSFGINAGTDANKVSIRWNSTDSSIDFIFT